MSYPGMTSVVDMSSPEAQYASLIRNWLTTYAQEIAKAQNCVNVAYARGYLQTWLENGHGGVSKEDLQAAIDLMNEFVNEYAGDDATLVNRLRTDM